MSLVQSSDRSRWQVIWLRLRILLDQILMILDLPTLTDNLDIRMARLRRIYYDDPKVTVDYRRVRDILRGHVKKGYRYYYQELLAAERATYQASRKLHSGTRADDLLYQVQRLGDKIARLIEELQDLDDIGRLYQNQDSAEAQTVERTRRTLTQRIEDALRLQKAIPARVIAFGSSTAERGIDRLQARIQRLANRLDDIAETYDEIDDEIEAFDTALGQDWPESE